MAMVSFDKLQDGSREDFILMAESYKVLCSPSEMTKRALGMLLDQRGIFGSAKVDLYEHALQTATRAYHNGEDEEGVVCCLLHDIGELLSPSNHGEIPAAILKPYISEKWYWILANHEVFQGFYYYHHVGGDKNARDIHKTNPHYQETVDFCEKYDALSFDPNFRSFGLQFFEPSVYRIFARIPYAKNPSDPKAVSVTGKMTNGDEKVNAYKSIGKYCSDNMVANRPFDMYSHDGYAKIVFESDSWITRPGFSLTYQLKSKSGFGLGSNADSSCYYSDASAAAIFYSSGWPYGYYASSTPCLRTYYVGANTLRVAVMDVSLYKRPLPYCNTTDSQFQIRASSRRFTTLSQFLSGATAVSGRICGTNTPTIYTAKNNYVYLYFNRPQPSTGYRGIMVGYIAYREDELDECARGLHHCSSNAFCTNTRVSYRCTCKTGYTGTGSFCSRIDVNECTLGTHRCDKDATCTNTIGSYRCACKSGFIGNGVSCLPAGNRAMAAAYVTIVCRFQ
ncbi:uncharacterized protein LOC135683523 isoform X3 [Rhopilema esculentum]|uniref:uncharacterized protein LOC135683523 isoform X3 n=1 Tax=Rhopilema esculentum TaxID=499914 RepID=UPI0031D25577